MSRPLAPSTGVSGARRVPAELYPFLTQAGGFNRVLADRLLPELPPVVTNYGANWLGPNGETQPTAQRDPFGHYHQFRELTEQLGLSRADLRAVCRADQDFIRWHLENCSACTPDFGDDLDIHDQWLTRGDGSRYKWADRRKRLRPSIDRRS